MPYLSTEDVKAKRKELRTAFPDFKLSVTKNNAHSGIVVTFLEGPISMLRDPSRGYEPVNHLWIDSHYEDKLVAEVLKKAAEIASRGKRIVNHDSDYGSIPNFYTELAVGRYDKPYVVRNA